MLSWDLRVRLDEPDSVHKMRIATRRIRSTLSSYRRLLDQPRARDLDERLKALAAELGVVRDAEVLQTRLLGELAREPVELVHGPVQRHITERLHGQQLRGRAALLQTLASDGYLRLVDELVDFVSTGVIDTAPASRRAETVLPKLVARRYRKLARRAKAARRADANEQAQALHQARKAAKQVRYASDAIEPAFGADAAALSKRAKRVQEVLGEHQDSVMAIAILRDLGLAAHAEAGESSFTFGLLVGVEQARAAEARRRFQPVWNEASRRKYRRWLR
jgi:CHAD domain-containing protein